MSLKDSDWSAGIKTFNAGKFAPKLTFQQQNAMFVFHHKFGISINVLAQSYHVAPRTVSVLVNRRAKEYQRVKKEERRIGIAAMYELYVFEEDIKRVQETVHGRTKIGIQIGLQTFTIKEDPETKKWIAFSKEAEVELGRFDDWKEAYDECQAFEKAGRF